MREEQFNTVSSILKYVQQYQGVFSKLDTGEQGQAERVCMFSNKTGAKNDEKETGKALVFIHVCGHHCTIGCGINGLMSYDVISVWNISSHPGKNRISKNFIDILKKKRARPTLHMRPDA